MKRWCAALLLVGCSSASPTTGGSDAPPPAADSGSVAPPAAADGGSVDAYPPSAPQDAGDASPPVDAAPPPPAAYLTTDDLSQALAAVTPTFGDTGTADAVVTVDPKTTYQPIVGFGASLTDSSSYVLSKYLSAQALTGALTQLFDPQQGVGLGFLRQPMGASDFSSVGNFSYDDADNDTSLAQFSIAQDEKATIPILRQVLSLNPSVFLMGTPWSPPAWMKMNGSMNGSGGASGNPGLAGTAYGPFGNYFVKFVQAYAKDGVPISAVTPQNEPLNGSANYPGMGLDAPSELSLIASDMGPSFKTAGLSTFIWAYDHNWDVESYPEQVVGDAVAGGFTEGAAFHCYGGDASAMSTFHQHFPSKSIYMTECSGGGWQDDPFASTIDLALDSTANWARAVALWNLALDEKSGPQNNGCPNCRGVVTVDSQSGKVTYNADYYALGHFSKFVRPGAVRVASTCTKDALKQVAFANASGRLVVVAHNTGSADLTVRVGSGAAAMNVKVPANAGVTFAWNP
ncbi:MAG TPA: glycoside hydrolase family 30 beta sandwich domain-containing protein [Polyangiaceae bacterium]|jgi:glucosylceramidase